MSGTPVWTSNLRVGQAEGFVRRDPMRLDASDPWTQLYVALSVAGTALGAYHGYKRHNNSIGWGIGWGLLGGAFPYIALPIAYAQGFGKRG